MPLNKDKTKFLGVFVVCVLARIVGKDIIRVRRKDAAESVSMDGGGDRKKTTTKNVGKKGGKTTITACEQRFWRKGGKHETLTLTGEIQVCARLCAMCM